jgi:hypothetical protein
MREIKNVYRILVGKHEGKRPRLRWQNNIKAAFGEVGLNVRMWTEFLLGWGPVMGVCEESKEPPVPMG